MIGLSEMIFSFIREKSNSGKMVFKTILILGTDYSDTDNRLHVCKQFLLAYSHFLNHTE